MKTPVLIALVFVSLASARADWKDLRSGTEKGTALEAVGSPLLMNKSRSGRQEVWTYDFGAYILFENGRVSYWQAPKPPVAVKINRVAPALPGTRLAKN